MVNPAAILSLLLAMLLALAPSPCLCPAKTAAAASSSCCPSTTILRDSCPLCDRQAAPGANLSQTDSGDPYNKEHGCNRCRTHCDCTQGPAMVAQVPATIPAMEPIALPIAFHFFAPAMHLNPMVQKVRIAAVAPGRPVVTLLRLACALTI